MENLKRADRLFLIGSTPYMKAYFRDFPVSEIENVWTDKPGAVAQIYAVQTAAKFVERCLLMSTDPGDLVLDPTCGSGTAAYVAEQWGRRWITIELLKKTGTGNLFMVFGEPDVDIKKQKDGNMTVEIKGVDVYDPTTGQIRSSSTDDIACWFIDTNYNGESFFVRHAYFTGADEPYDKLKRALRAEIDEAAWSSLYSTKSRPFEDQIRARSR